MEQVFCNMCKRSNCAVPEQIEQRHYYCCKCFIYMKAAEEGLPDSTPLQLFQQLCTVCRQTPFVCCTCFSENCITLQKVGWDFGLMDPGGDPICCRCVKDDETNMIDRGEFLEEDVCQICRYKRES